MKRIAALVMVGLLASSSLAPAAEQKLVTSRIKGRPAKLLHQALYARDGRLGFLEDVNNDGSDDFVHLVQTRSTLFFRIMSLLDAEPRVDIELGKGYPAGLGMVDLDGDDNLEFIAAYGSRRDRLAKKSLLIAASLITSAVVSIQTVPSTGYAYTFSYVGAPSGLDLQHIVAFDDDGTKLWQRDLLEGRNDPEWDNVRFHMLLPTEEGGSAVIILTNNVGNTILGLSGRDGSTLWTTHLEGNIPAARWSSAGLLDDDRILPVLYVDNSLRILDPQDGRVVQSETFDMAISSFPVWRTFGEGPGKGFLVYGDSGSILQMASLETGEILWSRGMEKVRAVLSLDEETFMVVWKYGIRKFSYDGTLLLDAEAPDKVKTKFDPVYKDVDGDGSLEFVFVSGKSVVCWNPETDKVLWEESLASFVGGANPVALYDGFHDIDQDGWLDVPAATGGGAGRWISGRTGKVIVETGAAFANPLVGDWDGNGLLELFWWNN